MRKPANGFTYFAKMQGGGARAPMPKTIHIFWSWCGGAVAIGLIAWIAQLVDQPLLAAPLGASAVLAFGVPDSPLAQPRNIIGGHIVAAFAGIVFLKLLGNDWWVMGLSVATAIAMMQFLRVVHPPAGANPLIVIMVGASWDYLLVPVAVSAFILSICAVFFNNLATARRYPLYW